MNDFDVVTGPAPAKLIPPPPVAEKPRERPPERTGSDQSTAVPAQAGTQGER